MPSEASQEVANADRLSGLCYDSEGIIEGFVAVV